MTIRVEDVGELGYGAAFAAANWWDSKQIDEGKLRKDEVFKRVGFWTYLGIGLPSTLISAMNWMPRQKTWVENISHGFLFYLPSFIMDTAKELSKPKVAGSSAAIAEANRILMAQRQTRVPTLSPGVGYQTHATHAYVAPEAAYQVT